MKGKKQNAYLLGNQVLSNDVVPGRNDVIHGDGLEGETQDAIELTGLQINISKGKRGEGRGERGAGSGEREEGRMDKRRRKVLRR